MFQQHTIEKDETLRILERIMDEHCIGLAKVARRKVIECKNLYIGVQITKLLWEKIRIWIVYKEYKPYPLNSIQRVILRKAQFDRVQKILEYEESQDGIEMEWNQIDSKKSIYDSQEHPLAQYRELLDKFSDQNIFKAQSHLNENYIVLINREQVYINNYLLQKKINNCKFNPNDILEVYQLCSIYVKIQKLSFIINQLFVFELKGQRNIKVQQLFYHIILDEISVILDQNELIYILYKVQKYECFRSQFIQQIFNGAMKQIELVHTDEQYAISCLEFKIHNYQLRMVKSINQTLTQLQYKLFVQIKDQFIEIAQASKLRKLKSTVNHIIKNQIYYSIDTKTILQHLITKVKQDGNFQISDQIITLSNKKLAYQKQKDVEVILILSQEIMIPLFTTQEESYQNILSNFFSKYPKYYDYRLAFSQYIDDQLIQKLEQFSQNENQGINLETIIDTMFNQDGEKKVLQLVQQQIYKEIEYTSFRNLIQKQ